MCPYQPRDSHDHIPPPPVDVNATHIDPNELTIFVFDEETESIAVDTTKFPSNISWVSQIVFVLKGIYGVLGELLNMVSNHISDQTSHNGGGGGDVGLANTDPTPLYTQADVGKYKGTSNLAARADHCHGSVLVNLLPETITTKPGALSLTPSCLIAGVCNYFAGILNWMLSRFDSSGRVLNAVQAQTSDESLHAISADTATNATSASYATTAGGLAEGVSVGVQLSTTVKPPTLFTSSDVQPTVGSSIYAARADHNHGSVRVNVVPATVSATKPTAIGSYSSALFRTVLDKMANNINWMLAKFNTSGKVLEAVNAEHSVTTDSCTEANHAATADEALHAATADTATSATTATTANSAATISGVLPVASGGTGVTSAVAERQRLFANSISTPGNLAVIGGSYADSASGYVSLPKLKTALAVPTVTYGTAAYTAGTTALATGTFYFQYV